MAVRLQCCYGGACPSTPTYRLRWRRLPVASGSSPLPWNVLTVAEVRRRCSARGIEEALPSRYIQFLCLRCGSFLSRADDGTSDVIMASDADLAFQDELLDACSSPYPNIDRVDRVVRMAVGFGHSLEGAAPRLMRHPTLSAVVRAYLRHRRLGVGELGVPEDPQLVAAILLPAWDISASEQVQYLAMCALGYRFPLAEREPCYFHRIAPSVLRTFMPVGSATLDEVLTARVRIRELMQNHGLQSVHIPCEVRFTNDAPIIDTVQYRWRRSVCLQLRHWLRCLELTARSDRNSSESAEEVCRTLTRADPLVQRSVYFIDATDAATFLSQILCLAEDLAKKAPALSGDSVAQISLSALHQLAPAAATATPATRGAQVARYWMWWDDAVGRDAYSYLPSCPPSELAAFDQSLGDDDRVALREYRARHSQDGAELP
jgi:hypothetical protein